MTSSRPNDIGTSRTEDRSRSGYSAFLGGGGRVNLSEAKRMPASFSMVPGIPQQSAASLSSTGSSADMAISSAREQAAVARRNNNQTSSVLAHAFSWNPPEESKPLPAHRFGSHGQQQSSTPQQNYSYPQTQQSSMRGAPQQPAPSKKRGGFNFLPQREGPESSLSSLEETKQGEVKQPVRQQPLLPAQEEQLKKQQMIKNIENKLMMLQMEKEKLSAEFEKIPESAKTIKDRKRRGELDMELGILGTNISSLKQKLRGLNALHKEY